jgi:dinuclear metal center YbgI/SA1388 family protein
MITQVRHITRFLDQWAPPQTSLDYDNVGLLLGDSSHPVKRILVCLDVTLEIVQEAIREDADLIVAHHPLIFNGLKRINPSNQKGKAIYELIQHDIAVIAAHTNLDAALDGVSFALAKKLELENLKFLDKSYPVSRKISLTTAGPDSEDVLKLLNYYSAEKAHVYDVQGRKGTQQNYEAIIDVHNLRGLKKELQKNGLLEKSSFQIVDLASPSKNAGMGVIGFYRDRGRPQESFLELVADRLDIPALRFSGSTEYVKKVAVCGGAGVGLASKAKAEGAQALITADVKYHDYFIDEPNFLLVDAGHYQTEAPILEVLYKELTEGFEEVQVGVAETITNPMQTFIHHNKSNTK